MDTVRDNQTSIKQALGATAPSGIVPGAPRRRLSDSLAYDPLPDWCNLGVTLRVALGVNALVFAILGSQAKSWEGWLETCLGAAAVVEPVLMASLLAGCLLRRHGKDFSHRQQLLVTVLVPGTLTMLYEILLGPLFPDRWTLAWRDGLSASGVCALVLYWAYLRSLSDLPALAEARLQALQARIRPHFLFNSLNAVLGLMRSDPRRAESLLEDLADLFRALMRDRRDQVSLAEELALCRQYLAIEGLRLGTRLQVHWSVDDNTSDMLVPLLLLQPLVENAVHHGIEPREEPGRIDIEVARVGNFVDIRITNPWLGDGGSPRGNQIGLDNVRQRLNLLFDLEAQLTAGVRDERFEVRVRLPFHTRT